MISYRYHLVTVIGIFLALALGVVIGTSALNGAVVGDLRRQVTDLQAQHKTDQATNSALSARAGDADLVAKTYGAQLVGGVLAKQPVTILATPGASSDLMNALTNEVAAAGGTVTGRVQLTSAFTDPARANDIKALATTGAHPVALQLPPTDDAGALAGALLGFGLFGKGQATDLTQIITGFSTLGMVKVTGALSAGRVLLLVTSGSLPVNDAGGATLASMSRQLATTGGSTVIAGDAASASAGGLIALTRANSDAKRVLSTVDDATTSLGQVSVVLAAGQALKSQHGQYGTAAGAEAVLPDTSG